jgi:hypothetical protein
MQIVDLRIDVTDAAGLGEPAWIAATIHLPEPVPAEPIICFAKPGGGYSRGYFTIDLPGPAKGAQAAWHAQRGWIFVSVDHLGGGRQQPARGCAAGLWTGHRGRPGGRSGDSRAACRRHAATGLSGGRTGRDDRHRPVDGRLPDDRAARPLSRL